MNRIPGLDLTTAAHPVATLREANRADVAAMHRVRLAVRENRLTSTTLCEADYIPAIETTGRGWVIELDGAVVAFAIGNDQTGNIWALFVHPEHECRGLGRRLHDAMVPWLFSRGLNRLWLSTTPGTRAERFYEAAGWQFNRKLPSGESMYELAMNSERDGDLAFSFRAAKGGDVTILRSGSAVTVLRGDAARRFLADMSTASFEEQQQAMARLTGNYKRGNERVAASHPRNRRLT